MGFFDFINRPDGPDSGDVPAGSDAGGGSTRATAALLEVPRGQRDPSWTRRFLARVADAAFFTGEPAVISGPDRLPLFALRSSAPGARFPGYVISHMKDDFLLEQGMGVVINPGGQDADWAFTYGDVLNLHLHGSFYPPQEPGSRTARLEPTPDARLPRVARAALRRFLQELGVAAPRVLFSAWDHAGPDSVELVFDFAPQEFSGLEAFRYAMHHISWFLPRNYSYSVAGNQARAEAGFEPL